jgi:hypothetical protein
MNDATHMRNQLTDRCSDCVPDAGKQLADLKNSLSYLQKVNNEQSVMLEKINSAIVGNYEKQGLIVRIDAQITALKQEVNYLKIWREGIDKTKNTFISKILMAIIPAIIIGATIAIAIIKMTANM